MKKPRRPIYGSNIILTTRLERETKHVEEEIIKVIQDSEKSEVPVVRKDGKGGRVFISAWKDEPDSDPWGEVEITQDL